MELLSAEGVSSNSSFIEKTCLIVQLTTVLLKALSDKKAFLDIHWLRFSTSETMVGKEKIKYFPSFMKVNASYFY